VNVPFGVTGALLTPVLLRESRDAVVKSFDAVGAVAVTAGLSAMVYAITQAGQDGWLAGRTVAFFVVSVALLAGFVAWELRHPEPLMRFGILRTRTVSGANIAGFILNIVSLSMFLLLTLYMQQVLGFSAMQTGLAYLAVALSAIVWSTVAAQLVTRVGVKRVLVVGMTALAVALAYFTQISVGGSYVGDLLPGFLLIGFGLGFSFVPISIAALAGIEPAEAGLASGLINTSQQVGGALGIAALSTIATSRTEDAVVGGASHADGLVTGFHAAFVAAVIVVAIGVVASFFLVRSDELEQPLVEPLAEPEPLLDLAA
jgi:MFS family permease